MNAQIKCWYLKNEWMFYYLCINYIILEWICGLWMTYGDACVNYQESVLRPATLIDLSAELVINNNTLFSCFIIACCPF